MYIFGFYLYFQVEESLKTPSLSQQMDPQERTGAKEVM